MLDDLIEKPKLKRRNDKKENPLLYLPFSLLFQRRGKGGRPEKKKREKPGKWKNFYRGIKKRHAYREERGRWNREEGKGTSREDAKTAQRRKDLK